MEPPKLFKELVKAGTALEDEAREALETTTAARNSVEERINRVRENFHNQRPARIEDLTNLHKKVDQLSRKVDRLTKALAEQGVTSKSARHPQTGSRRRCGRRKKPRRARKLPPAPKRLPASARPGWRHA